MRKTRQSAVIALGSNIEPREEYLREALAHLRRVAGVEVCQSSPIYETVPKGYADQDDFLNMVVEVETLLPADDLLSACQAIEEALHRKRTIKNGPRTIDLDIILYSQERYQTERLTVPHPRMQERAFVLFPLADILPERSVPGFFKTVLQLKQALPEEEKADVRLYPSSLDD